ncbi:MAG: dihydrofolate reductase [Bacteroidetes bacterium]|nr:MAG: dihydrofolate reductase [Bacteroidota bacterium]
MWKVIAAISAYDRGIGVGGHLPWHIPLELRLFRQETWGGVLVVGRRTWESLGRPLPGREVWVLSRQLRAPQPGVRFFSDKAALLQALQSEKRPVFFAGGAQIYEWALSLPQVTDLLLSWVYVHTKADVFFPPLSETMWRLHAVEFFGFCDSTPGFVWTRYKRISQ